ncbi:hypothetical protein N8218_02125, partial [bacterium]|nr:hypothetical protein [bacterium]
SQAMAFDDFYMSPAGSFLSTVPVASGLGKAAAGPPVITSLSYDKVTGEVTVVWSSSPNTNYAIHYSETLEEGSWVESDDSIPSTDTVTTKTLDETFSQSKLFFRVSVPNE